MKRLFSAVIAVILAFTAVSASANDIMTAATRLEGCVMQLGGYLANSVEDEDKLTVFIDNFYAIGGKNARALGVYCEVLLCLAQEKYESAVSKAEMIADNESFGKYVTDEIGSEYIEDGISLLQYSEARRAEAAGDDEEALKMYKKCFTFFDATARKEALESDICEEKYSSGIMALNDGDFALAIECFEFTNKYDYKNSAALLRQAQTEADAPPEATPAPMDALSRKNMAQSLKLQGSLAAGEYMHSVALREDGTVEACGDNGYGQCDLDKWRNIVCVEAAGYHTVGLKSDGTVVTAGNNTSGQLNVEDWKNIIFVSAGRRHTVGLMKNGTVVAVGDNEYGQCDVESWRDIIAISCGSFCTLGLKADGTVVGTGKTYTITSISGENVEYYPEVNVADSVKSWRDIIAVSGGAHHVVGLRSDGTVIASGKDNYFGECNVGQWSNIIAVSAQAELTLGLRADGRVMATGSFNYYKAYEGYLDEIGSWRDVVAISAGYMECLALDKYGNVLAAGGGGRGANGAGLWRGIGPSD